MAGVSYLSEHEVAASLSDFERINDPFGLHVKGVSLWQLLRPSLGFRLQNLSFSKPRLSRWELFTASFRGLFLAPLLWGKTDYLAFSFYSGLRQEVAGKFEDVWFDALLDHIPNGKKVVRLNAANFTKNLSRARIRPAYDATLMFNLAGLLARLLPVKDKGGEYLAVAQLANRLVNSPEYTREKIQRMFSRFWWHSRLQRIILRLSGARYCLAVGTAEFPLMHACREAGVKYVELQHGIFTADNPYCLPSTCIRHREVMLWPARIALYGEYWRRNLRDTAQAQMGLLVSVGNAMLEKFQAQRKASFDAFSTLKIVITTHGPDKESLQSFLKSFLSQYPHPLRLVLKLHPAYDPDPALYSTLLASDPRVTVWAGHEGESTYSLLATSHFHLSIASACHFDALAIGIPTGVLKMAGYEIMQPILEAQVAPLISSPEELISWIQRSGSDSGRLSQDFCVTGFTENIRSIFCENPG